MHLPIHTEQILARRPSEAKVDNFYPIFRTKNIFLRRAHKQIAWKLKLRTHVEESTTVRKIAKRRRNRPLKCCMFILCALFTKLDRPVHYILNHLFASSRKYSLSWYSSINLLIGRFHADSRVNASALAALLIGFSIM